MVEEDIEFVTFDGVSITKSELRDEIINIYITANLDGMTKVTDFSIGSEAYHLADTLAGFLLEQRELVDTNYRMSMIHTSEGEFLDNMGDTAGVHRISSSPSVGVVQFSRLTGDEPISIPEGSIVSTMDSISFFTEETVTLEEGMESVEVPVVCEQDGAYTNVEAGTIRLVMGDLGQYVSVTNPERMTDGEDIEDDDTYRNRILESPYTVPTGTLAWYELVAEGLESVHDVTVTKGLTQSEADVHIIYNPTDWTDTTIAEEELISTFAMKEYDVVGVTMDYTLCDKTIQLLGTDGLTYYFALLLEDGYDLSMVKEDVVNRIIKYNRSMSISIEFSPSTLATLISEEIEGINECRIVSYDGEAYRE